MVIFFITLSLLILGILIATLPDKNARHPDSREITKENRNFPDAFIWFTGEDAYQHEEGNRNTDWAEWEEQETSPITDNETNEKAAFFLEHFDEDIQRAADAGHNAHRIGIEWARVEPEVGKYDDSAFAMYESMLTKIRDKGMKTFLNLWHFTLPKWAANVGGWESAQVAERWRDYVSECAKRFGHLVNFWSTMIDAQIFALKGYATGEYPPFVKDLNRAVAMYDILIRAHADAYRIIKDKAQVPEGVNTEPQIGHIYYFAWYEPKAGFPHTIAYKQMDRIFNTAFLDALYTGRLKLNVLGGPSINTEIPGAKNSLDWIGVNYYTRELIGLSLKEPGLIQRTVKAGTETTDMGWEIFPEGLYKLLHRLAKRYPEVPLYITESGLADAQDSKRPNFILEHLAWTHQCIQEGLPVRGFAYWSWTDNWEWHEGYWPKFGLYEVDRKTGERIERPSARLYKWITEHNKLPSESERESLLNKT